MNGLIIGAGKIGIDLYIKCRRKNFLKIFTSLIETKVQLGRNFAEKIILIILMMEF
jgi:hypothetical protein